jgi:hypothetical protein
VVAALVLLGAGVVVGSIVAGGSSGERAGEGAGATEADPGAGTDLTAPTDRRAEDDGVPDPTPETTVVPDPTAATTTTPFGQVQPGRWILVLDSLPKAERSIGEAQGAVTAIGDARAVLLDSDATPGLNGGFWVVAVADFASRSDATAACAGFGRAIGGSCYPTRIGDGAR